MRRGSEDDEVDFEAGTFHAGVQARGGAALGSLFKGREQFLEQLRETLGAVEHQGHQRVSNLAQLLQATNRLAEAEPLMWRALTILCSFTRYCGHEHPDFQTFADNYVRLLV
jgi:hypothetical protein